PDRGRIAKLAYDQNLPEYHPDPTWKRFSSRNVQQDMVNKGWRKMEDTDVIPLNELLAKEKMQLTVRDYFGLSGKDFLKKYPDVESCVYWDGEEGEGLMQALKAQFAKDSPSQKEDRPDVLFHKIIHEPKQSLMDSIFKNRLAPQVASEYKDLVPEEIRDKPVVWLASKLHSYTDAPVLLIETDRLDATKLYHVEDNTLDWWVYEDSIPISSLMMLGGYKDRPDREKIANYITGFGCGILSSWDGCGDCEGLKEGDKCQGALEVADQISALFPDIEQAKREVLIELDNIFYLAPNDDSYLRILLKGLYEALKVGKWPKAELGLALKSEK
ncbi:hypothetical protein LCGC14_2941740, partial [marine sediment metagenome]